MKESKWMSLSIMDLHSSKRASSAGASRFGSALSPTSPTSSRSSIVASSRERREGSVISSSGGQSYELIKSTQSLIERLNLNAEEITIQSVHPSIIGQDTWFQITYVSSGTTRYFSCQSPKERDEWIASLKKTLMMNEDRRRTDNSLRIDVLELKGLSEKKKYYAEILVDDKLYARTSAKKMTNDHCCFWGEHFEFKDLPQNAEKIGLLIHKEKSNPASGGSKRKKPKKPVGRLKISISSVKSRYIQDKWYTVEKSSRRDSPSIRLRCQFSSIDILPLRAYESFLYFLKDEYKDLCRLLEPNISVKVKEELSTSLMNIFHAEEMAEDVLADIVVDEISSVENEHLTFRGNSIATKAMEAYIKLVGQKYLQDTLRSLIEEILNGEMDLEVDPVKVANASLTTGSSVTSTAAAAEALILHRSNLTRVVKQVWGRIANSHALFPITLQRCFYKIRQYLQHVGKPDVGDNLISACIFLRYLCPAILAPSLFNLSDEYPSERANRNLTLVAKTLQTLANFTKYEGKENSMEFLNPFLENEMVAMKSFLGQISSPLAEDGWIPNLSAPVEKTDLGKHLSCLHTILFENVSKVPADNPKAERLRQLLDEINEVMDRPTIPQLEKISRPTLNTLKSMQEETAPNNPRASVSSASTGCVGGAFGGITLPWIGTLPKKTKTPTNMSHPAPHHETPKVGIFGSRSKSQKVPTSLAVLACGSSNNEANSPSSETSSTASLTSPVFLSKDRRSAWFSGHGEARTSASSSRSSASGIVIGGRHVHRPVVCDPYIVGPSATRSLLAPPPSQNQRQQRSSNMFLSSMSLEDSDSSDDSTYSSQYQSDANSTQICTTNSQTLPRQLIAGNHNHYSTASRISCPSHHHLHGVAASAKMETKSLSDYEQEIIELRTAMEQLQIKLGEAESKLQARNYVSGVRGDPPARAAESDTSDMVNSLLKADDLLRRGPLETRNLMAEDKGGIVDMEQEMDEVSGRMVGQLGRLSDRSCARDGKTNASVAKSTPNRVASSSSFGGPASTLVAVNSSPPPIPCLELGVLAGARTVTPINAFSNSLSTSPHPSTTSSSSGGVAAACDRRFGSPSSTISSSSVASSGHPPPHGSSVIAKKSSSPNRCITVITNGQALPQVDEKIYSSMFESRSEPSQKPTPNNSAHTETPKTVDELLDSLHSTPI